MTTPLRRLGQNYRPAFLSYLARRDEPALHAAYELGRAALAGGVNLLDLVRIHHAVLGEVLLNGPEARELQEILDAAAGFLVESLAPFEIARRSFLEKTATRPECDRG